jgi:hypothetical protein
VLAEGEVDEREGGLHLGCWRWVVSFAIRFITFERGCRLHEFDAAVKMLQWHLDPHLVFAICLPKRPTKVECERADVLYTWMTKHTSFFLVSLDSAPRP